MLPDLMRLNQTKVYASKTAWILANRSDATALLVSVRRGLDYVTNQQLRAPGSRHQSQPQVFNGKCLLHPDQNIMRLPAVRVPAAQSRRYLVQSDPKASEPASPPQQNTRGSEELGSSSPQAETVTSYSPSILTCETGIGMELSSDTALWYKVLNT